MCLAYTRYEMHFIIIIIIKALSATWCWWMCWRGNMSTYGLVQSALMMTIEHRPSSLSSSFSSWVLPKKDFAFLFLLFMHLLVLLVKLVDFAFAGLFEQLVKVNFPFVLLILLYFFLAWILVSVKFTNHSFIMTFVN